VHSLCSWNVQQRLCLPGDLLKSEGFAKHEDDEADVYFKGLEILLKEKRWVEKVQGVIG